MTASTPVMQRQIKEEQLQLLFAGLPSSLLATLLLLTLMATTSSRGGAANVFTACSGLLLITALRFALWLAYSSAWRCWWSGSEPCRSCSTRARSSTGQLRPDHDPDGLRRSASPSSSPGSSPKSTRSSTCACSARRNFLMGTLALSVPTAFSSATSCCCRSGCSSTWATPRPGPAWRRRRSDPGDRALAVGRQERREDRTKVGERG